MAGRICSRGLVAILVAAAAAVLGLLTLASAAHAATITVNSTADDVDGADSECTLREAITAANDNMGGAGGECVAGGTLPTV